MYMLRAQKRLQSIERHEEEARRMEQIDRHIGGLKIVRGAVSDDIPEEGPAGAKKKVKYVGSFKVYPPPGLSGKDLQRAISGFVWERINAINPKNVGNPISATMIINRHSVKIYKSKELFMAYPLKKITYCTAVPKMSLFAMVTRAILDQPDDVVYCHSFGLPSAEHANEVSQLLSEAFKIAFAHRTLRHSIAMESKGSKGKDKKSSKLGDLLKRKDKKLPAASPSLSHSNPSAPPPPSSSSSSSSSNRGGDLGPPAGGGGQDRSVSPVMRKRTGSVSSGVTSVGLEAEIVSLEQRVADLEMKLLSLPPNDDKALEITIKLSALEDQLHVKRNQLDSLLQIEGDTSNQDRPPSYNELGGASQPQPPTHELLLPPAYSDLQGGMGPGGAGRPVSAAYEDQELELKDAVWYQAGLPRELIMEILKDQPSGSFMVRDSSSNPGCHAISLVAPDGEILHYLIVKDVYGYYINGSDRHHPTLLSLILHHAIHQEFLPVVLFLGATNPLAPLPPPPGADGGGGAMGGIPTDGSNDWLYDDDVDDEEMQAHLTNLQFIHP
ncbi:PREDICTED: uncharacterized protein LOC100633394 [Amphimedon queenslandica]|uniref:SH2 domain-containing protein n=2 Tax=Amphimedon queenslandica TaxID=400682 RepID=A0A1X7UE50_AMPQE|nr:PREDICTED: uncharacterized protein LOC100633394 [Amphimedon queenslandica]|eukprot:XP_003388256.2 PREDICTED: uncharacterized protein LOC100633394 [Amphimedon queenslandica]